MATLNIGGRSVEVPDDLDLPRQAQGLKGAADAAPRPPQPQRGLVPIPGTGDNGYRPNFTIGGNPPPQQPSGAARAGQALRDGASWAWDKTKQAASSLRPDPNVVDAATKGGGRLRQLAQGAGGFLSKAGAVGGVGYGVYNTATGLADSDYTKAGLGAADTAASASLVTPAAPIGATWLGARAAHDVLQGAADKFDLGDTIGGTINQIGLRTGLWGTDDSAYLQQKAQSAAPAPTNLRDPAITGPSVVRPSDAFAGPDVRYAGADYQPPTAQPPANPNAPTNDVTKTVGPDGRVSYSGGNVGGNITINGSGQLGGGSISPQNMAAADALVGRQAQQSAQRAMADMPMAQAPTVLHSGNDWASRNALRNLEVTASSAMNYSERCSSRETYRI